MTETQRLVWVLSTPACVEVNNAMQDFTSVTYRTSEQNVDITRARQTKDISDLQELLNFLESNNPFNLNYTTLWSIATGMTANNAVNAHKAKDVRRYEDPEINGRKKGFRTFFQKEGSNCNTGHTYSQGSKSEMR